mmetsp:Transcript_23619/g.41875  ORF Transcript_23619/g.41875 Transcript_23619/m.41875 type:complete len:202 (+) Transcript_23619:4180-4785(+)
MTVFSTPASRSLVDATTALRANSNRRSRSETFGLNLTTRHAGLPVSNATLAFVATPKLENGPMHVPVTSTLNRASTPSTFCRIALRTYSDRSAAYVHPVKVNERKSSITMGLHFAFLSTEKRILSAFLTNPSTTAVDLPAPLSPARGTSPPPYRPRSGGRRTAPGTSSAGSPPGRRWPWAGPGFCACRGCRTAAGSGWVRT